MVEADTRSRIFADGSRCFVIAEIGINHNGDIETAKRLIGIAAEAGCDAVKFQKRTIEVCVPEEQKNVRRETPWGSMTYGEYRHRVEFGRAEYVEIDAYCRELGVQWTASCWDTQALEFIEEFDPPFHKVASACLTDDSLLAAMRRTNRQVLLSTGMSTLEQIDHAVEIIGTDNLIIMHTCSAYPANYDELNLRLIKVLRDRYGVPVGYSGHETGIATTVAAFAMGAVTVERHVTLDRAMWGSDQAASLEPSGLARLVRDIRLVEQAFGSEVKELLPREIPVMKKLRRF